MRERSSGEVLDHEGNALRADAMAASMSLWEEEWIVASGREVLGSID